jgi:hypothetical protein
MSQTHKKIVVGLAVIIVIIILAIAFNQTPTNVPDDRPLKEDSSTGKSSQTTTIDADEPISSNPNMMILDIAQDADQDDEQVLQNSAQVEAEAIQSDIDRINTINQTYDDSNF